MADDFNWRCPYCEHDVTITEKRFREGTTYSHVESADSTLAVKATFFICPNQQCRRTTVEVLLGNFQITHTLGGPEHVFTKVLGTWRLKPWGSARAFPDYVPATVRTDYEEACSIADLSPKAAATLAR